MQNQLLYTHWDAQVQKGSKISTFPSSLKSYGPCDKRFDRKTLLVFHNENVQPEVQVDYQEKSAQPEVQVDYLGKSFQPEVQVDYLRESVQHEVQVDYLKQK